MTSTATTRRWRRGALGLLTAGALASATVATSLPAQAARPAEPHPAAVTPAGSPPPEEFWGDVGSIPPAQNELMVKVVNQTNGQYPDDQVYWTFNGETHSIAEQPYLDMPANSAGRMEFHLGAPDSPLTDFIEFTVGENVFNGNTTRVDAFGLKLAMRLHADDGFDASFGEDYETFQESREQTFQKFRDEVPEEFEHLADDPNRIIAPGSSPDFQDGGAQANYFTDYANSVGVNETTKNIFGCAGGLGGDANKCAALNRHVADLPEDQQHDPSKFYPTGPANYYAKFWHDHNIDGKAYGFPYDDVAEQASYVSHEGPQWLVVAVGW
ncbi:glycoside hydrolase family 64 protein [Saccharopolyspora sp. TS4A08]|uniref:Glycoside hydrolase family 64 protein n=1 Tax=Saccharopolyspora ipomoeae TaxID=3042027 RepID=A0ABT6PHX9_9PSEU|nr:glycoside hydrolase family 64 protein [Saccharopolyspora sp. TS4A08]MDI2027569.1 glycoside hydrolase family 64 protein [Saccharopolyspora sp. TS4A08]